jgi:hypothetical protein
LGRLVGTVPGELKRGSWTPSSRMDLGQTFCDNDTSASASARLPSVKQVAALLHRG